MNNMNDIFARLNSRLDNMAAARSQMKEDYLNSIRSMRAEHAAAVADAERRFAQLQAEHNKNLEDKRELA